MKIVSLMMTVAVGTSLLVGCGGGGAGDARTAGEGETASPATPGDAEAPQPGSGESADVQAFLEDYEKFVDRYCEFTDRFTRATMTEMVDLAQEVAAQGMELTGYSTRAINVGAATSPAIQGRLEALQKKAEACGEKIGG